LNGRSPAPLRQRREFSFPFLLSIFVNLRVHNVQGTFKKRKDETDYSGSYNARNPLGMPNAKAIRNGT
jgi:arginine decarboxylase-like protein